MIGEAEFRLLGPLEVVMDGRQILPSATRQKLLLALLVIERGKAVSVEKIIDALWPEGPPPTARSQVQITVSALRKVLGGDVIVTRSPGYLANVTAGAVDLARFEALAADAAAAKRDGRVADAIRLMRSALALWRGPALDGLKGDIFLAAATRLNERRISLLQNCIDLEFRLDRHDGLIGELREHVARYPLDERFRAQLVLALARAGRKSEALEVLRAGRKLLSEEMGLDPAEELRRLEHSILVGDSNVDFVGARETGTSGEVMLAPVPRQLPMAIPGFVGRGDIISEMRRLLSAERERSAVDVPLVVLTGGGGIGKTALAVRVAHLVHGGFPDGQLFLQFPSAAEFGPADMLGDLLRGAGGGPASVPPDLDGRTAMYRSWLADRRVLIVIDGAASASEVTPFLPGTPSCAVIVTSRQRLTDLPSTSQIEVGPLDTLSAFDLMAYMVGRRRVTAEVHEVMEVIRLCEGMPLALRIVGVKLAARPHWRVAQMAAQLRDRTRRLAELELDKASVRTAIELSCRGLGPEARSLLMRLSLVVPGDFPSWIGAPLLDTDRHSAEDALQQLADAHLVEAFSGESGSVRYRLHDLVRIYAEERAAEEEGEAVRAAAVNRLLGVCGQPHSGWSGA